MKDTSSNHWNEFWKSQEIKKPGFSYSKKRILDILNHYMPQTHCALDAGCGSGFFSCYFVSRGIETFSIDYSDQALSMTSTATQGKSQLLKIDLLNHGLSKILNRKFDLIFTDGLFEHFNSNEQDLIMNNFKTALKPSGIIATFVPNRWSPWELIRPLFMPGIEEKPFEIRQLRDLNQRNGLRVIEYGGINVIPFRWSPDKILGAKFGMLLYSISNIYEPH